MINNIAENMTDILHSSGLFVVVEAEATQTSSTADDVIFPDAFYDYFELEAA